MRKIDKNDIALIVAFLPIMALAVATVVLIVVYMITICKAVM